MSTTEIQSETDTDAPEETQTPSSSLNTDALAAFADEEETQEDESPRAVSPDLDDVLKDVPERTWRVSGMLYGKRRQGRQIVDVKERFEATYVQKPLSYLAFMQFTALLGRKLDELMADGTVSVQNLPSLMAVPDELSNVISRNDETGRVSLDLSQVDITQVDFSGVDAFVRGFAKLASYAPEILAEAQCIWLRVPPRERLAVIDVWSRPVDEGGLSNDEGEEMMDVFLNQNYEELERFFQQRLRRWIKRIQSERKRLHPPED